MMIQKQILHSVEESKLLIYPKLLRSRNIFLLIMALLIISCYERDQNESEQSVDQSKGAITKKMETAKIMEIPVDLIKEKEIQEAVDQGHQPWRLSPTDVAHVAIISYVDKEIKYEDCKLVSEEGTEATVIARKGKRIYRVYLKKLVRPDGIWTATKIEVAD